MADTLPMGSPTIPMGNQTVPMVGPPEPDFVPSEVPTDDGSVEITSEANIYAHSIQTLEGVIIRCGCGDPLRIHPGFPCPTPRRVVNVGLMSYANPDHPIKELFMKLYIKIRRRLNYNRENA